jgi:ABC-type microcin C transport system permease subunit YejE
MGVHSTDSSVYHLGEYISIHSIKTHVLNYRIKEFKRQRRFYLFIHLFIYLFIFGAGDETQGLANAKQRLCH